MKLLVLLSKTNFFLLGKNISSKYLHLFKLSASYKKTNFERTQHKERIHDNFFLPLMKRVCKKNCSDLSIEVKLPALLGNNDRPTNQPTNRRTDQVIGEF